ncbi:lipid kinase [Phyllobacterium zundukense]|uniref:Lipid kinase n=1 Tax=Phyllobacterium zundukense TaxID=1867719 RepID=A0A2N9W546_9HYPH|nr:lipid kinase [Phyllobacterium zundukense]ATU93765.1 lipid kinase [Phyllobacterium zundukense]PIO46864.1 lipid kinase [Phyllobacterium zundukense]
MTGTLHKRALLIVNPNARSGKRPIAPVREMLESGGLTLVDAAPTDGETLSNVISRMRDACDLVIIGGGDGTLNSAAAGLVDTGLPLGVLPLGTANDFARTIGIPADPHDAARLILSAAPQPIDLGEVNGHLFFNVASIGFSAELAGELTEKAKKRWGKLGYAIVAARLLARSRLFTAYVEHDGSVDEIRTMQVSVGNGRHYGGGMTVEQTATADDGRLDFYSLEVDHWWRLLALLPSLRKGTHGKWDDVRAFHTTEVIVKTSKPRAVNTDGDLTTWTPAHFRIREKAIRVFAPATENRDFGSKRNVRASEHS